MVGGDAYGEEVKEVGEGLKLRLGRIIPVFPPIILSFDSPKTTHYSHNLVPIILELFSIRAVKDAQQ